MIQKPRKVPRALRLHDKELENIEADFSMDMESLEKELDFFAIIHKLGLSRDDNRLLVQRFVYGFSFGTLWKENGFTSKGALHAYFKRHILKRVRESGITLQSLERLRYKRKDSL